MKTNEQKINSIIEWLSGGGLSPFPEEFSEGTAFNIHLANLLEAGIAMEKLRFYTKSLKEYVPGLHGYYAEFETKKKQIEEYWGLE